jgi:hypothetical protein
MDLRSIEKKKNAVVDQFGPWAASNIHIGGDLYTIGKTIHGDEIKLRRVLQIVADTTRRPIASLRLLDLACHEGIYAIEFARHGARVVGIEGRDAHIRKAIFVKEALALNNLEIYPDDVRNLSEAKYGSFDVVLCLGILYHLDVPDVFTFLEKIGEVCQDVAIIDTRIAMGPTEAYVYNGTKYWGHPIREGHQPTDTPAEKMKRYWASLDNLTSFHLSRISLFCMLSRVGFTSVYECYVPSEPSKPIDRITIVALKGCPQQMKNSPLMADLAMPKSPEEFAGFKLERAYGRLYRLSRMLPEKIRVLLKSRGPLGKLFRPLPEAIGSDRVKK